MFLKRNVRVAAVLGCSIVVLCSARAAIAQEYCGAADWARVVELSGDAKGYLDEDMYDEALVALRKAFVLCPDPRLHRSIGKVYLAAGRNQEAVSEFEACLASKVGMDVKDECRRFAAEASRAIESAAVSTVVVPTPKTETPKADEAVAGADAGAADGGVAAESPAAAAAETPESVHAAPQTSLRKRKAGALDPVTVPNWVGIGIGVAALGVGVGFLAQYGLDVRDVEENPFEQGDGGYWPREVGVTNVAVGASFAAAGVIAVVLSAALWPDANVSPVISAAPGGGVVGFVVGL